MTERKVHVVVVTGLSGSGKSTAIKAFEDLDYFCIDNLPVPLLPDFLSLCEKDMPDISKIALGIDIRERKFLKDYETIFKRLEDLGYSFEMIFLEAATDILQRRYSQTRRVHPAGSSDSLLLDAIHSEREQLKALRSRATRILDTGNLSVHQLKAMITRSFSMIREKEMLAVQVLSFGFKYGLPFEADLVMDVRFLPNPHFVENLRKLDGSTSEIRSWVLQWPAAQDFIDDFSRLVLKLLPSYVSEGKRYLTIAIGCTGGKHRSVVIADQVADKLEKNDYFVNVFHRDIHLE
ncbi:RNase adapter RapZ [Desulforhabdus amnigena]|uniref:Nucleotide-binding protein n=1 Tax=Desulforhabdus amnigena TaxID=40218 RepID=A0A9W6L916_9BACT|nr:RNase adapter RapZ [Desulforhabdus amnigena]GLI36192.1 nucleotide-binding protein [Desulforhabdus amnigena]